MLAKWLSMRPRADHLRRADARHRRRRQERDLRADARLADAGVAILMISSDMEEVIGVSDRIAVMHEGRDQRLPRAEQFSEHNVLGSRSAGGRETSLGKGEAP